MRRHRERFGVAMQWGRNATSEPTLLLWVCGDNLVTVIDDQLQLIKLWVPLFSSTLAALETNVPFHVDQVRTF